jgi:hypothetical protein
VPRARSVRAPVHVCGGANTWQGGGTAGQAINVVDLHGMIAALQQAGASSVGAYSASWQWTRSHPPALLLNPTWSTASKSWRTGSVPMSRVHGEAKRRIDVGLLLRREAGRSAMVRANRVTACFKLLAELLPSGPLLQVVAAEFSGNGQSRNGR